MNQNQPVVIISRAVIRLALTDPDKTTVNIVIGDIIVFAEVAIVESKFAYLCAWLLSESLMAVRLCRFVILKHRSVGNDTFIRTAELQLSKTKHQRCAPFTRERKRLQEYHLELLGIPQAINTPINPAMVPVIIPPNTSEG